MALIIFDDVGARETDIKLTIFPLAGEKHTLRVPLIQKEPSESLPKIGCMLYTLSRNYLPILVANFSTVSDKRTLEVLQHKELMFICCSLLQIDGMMARCVVSRLAEV